MRRFFVLAAVGLLLVGAAACDPAKVDNSLGISEKEFGASVTPWDVPAWTAAVGAKPTSVLMFEQWSMNRNLDKQFAEAKTQGLHSVTVTWEPWTQVPASAGQPAQYAVQPQWSNARIASGALDSYIKMFALSVKNAGIRVYIRYAHEMNGVWYPWSHDPANYVLAWRRIVTIFRAQGATNAKFVFAPNASLYQTDTQFENGVEPYWPGSAYVDYIGATMINWGGTKNYTVARFIPRLKLIHSLFPLHMFISEANTDYATRVQWLTDLKTWLISKDSSWVIGINLSQYPSRGQIQMGNAVGNMNWNVEQDPSTQPIIKTLIKDITA